MIKAGLFMRVSTKDQHTENQKEALIQLISDRNYELAKIYDVTASATGKDNLESSYLDEVYEDARLGIINVLVVSIIFISSSFVSNENVLTPNLK